MKKYIVIKYEPSDFETIEKNMTAEKAAEILNKRVRGEFHYRSPATCTYPGERDLENFEVCCALDLAIKILRGGTEE